MSKKSTVTAEIPLEGNDSRTYTGRLLGLIKDDEFNALVQKVEAMKKVETRPTVALCPMFMEYDEVVGHRFVLATRKINGADVQGKKMFISERLDEVSEVNPNTRKVQLKTASGKFIYLEERD